MPLLLALAQAAEPPPVAPRLDLGRYADTWYELARLPNFFERGCAGVTAAYVPRHDGRLTVINRWRKGDRMNEVRGEARVPEPAAPARLEVQLFWPFQADSWVLEVAPDYRYALVGDPKRKSAWLLSRSPTLEPATYERLVGRLRELGFDTVAWERVPQP